MHRRLAMLLSTMLAATILHAQTQAPAVQTSQPSTATAPAVNEVPPTLSTKLPTGEDWSTTSLAQSGLPFKNTGAFPLSKTQLPGCTRELLQMHWRPNDSFDLYVIRPEGAAKLPVILFLYNYTVGSDVFQKDGWCEQAKKYGFAVVGFASPLSWERIHTPRPMKEWFVSELQEALATSTHDVEMILNYLDSRGDLDIKHVGMFGDGSGGAVAILAASADPRIGALDLMNPWGDWPEWLKASKQIPEEERAAYLKPDFLKNVSNLDPVTYLPHLKVKALRIQQLMTDTVTPDPAKDKIAQATPNPKDVVRYADVAARAKAWGPSGGFSWLTDQIRPTEQPQPSALGSASQSGLQK